MPIVTHGLTQLIERASSSLQLQASSKAVGVDVTARRREPSSLIGEPVSSAWK